MKTNKVFLQTLREATITNLKSRGLPINERSIQAYLNTMAEQSVTRIQQEIANKLNPITPEEIKRNEERRAAQREESRLAAIKHEEDCKRWKAEAEERRRNFKPENCEVLKLLKVGQPCPQFGGEILAILPNYDLLVRVENVEGYEKHLRSGQIVTFECHEDELYGDRGTATWTLKAEDHLCYEAHLDWGPGYGSYGADVLLMFMDGVFLDDLDS